MTERVPAERMEDPPGVIYLAAGLLLAVAAVVALVVLPDRRPQLLTGIVTLAVIGAVSGWLFTRKGYAFLEGWFAGIAFFPLAIAFGIWGPRRAGPGSLTR